MPKSSIQKPASKAETAASENGFSLIPNQKLIAIYTALLRCRMLSERTNDLFAMGKLSRDLRASPGREAAATAVVVDLQPGNALSLATGDILPAFAKGLPLKELLRDLSVGSTNLDSQSAMFNKGSLDQLQIIPSAQTDTQVAAIFKFARAAKRARKGKIAVAFFDASASETQLSEAIDFAANKLLPIVFVRFTTDHAQHERSESPSNIKKSAPAALVNGSPAIIVDAGDAVALYRVSFEAIARARQDRGPTVVECQFHTFTPASLAMDSIYRVSGLPGLDPVSNMENYLKSKGLWKEEVKQTIVAGFERELDLATGFLFT